MARPPRATSNRDEISAPESYPQVPPPRVQHTHDFTLQAVMEMQKTLGVLCTKVDRLIEDQGKSSEKINGLATSFDRFRVGVIVTVAILTAVGTAFGWVMGDRIKTLVQSGVDAAFTRPAAPTAPPPIPKN